jgi:hypothetical protein
VIPARLERAIHSLEGRCSEPLELPTPEPILQYKTNQSFIKFRKLSTPIGSPEHKRFKEHTKVYITGNQSKVVKDAENNSPLNN